MGSLHGPASGRLSDNLIPSPMTWWGDSTGMESLPATREDSWSRIDRPCELLWWTGCVWATPARGVFAFPRGTWTGIRVLMAVPDLFVPYFVSDALYIIFVTSCCGLGTWCGRLCTH